MNDQDLFKAMVKSREIAARISPKFNELTFDLDEAIQKCNDPLFIAVLLFKVAEEREKSNKIIQEMNDKFDKVMLELKTQAVKQDFFESKNSFEVLPEADQKIMTFIERKGFTTAEEIKQELNYKGLNAACQRLNSLFKQGMLKKIQSGKKVNFMLARQPTL